MDQHQRRPVVAAAGIAQAPRRGVDELVLRRRVLVFAFVDGHLVGRDIGIDVVIADLRRREHRQQRPHRVGFARVADATPQKSRVGGFHGARDLVGFDLHDLVADADLGTFVDQPLDEDSLAHRQPPFGHQHGCYAVVAHGYGAMVLRTASAICSALGM